MTKKLIRTRLASRGLHLARLRESRSFNRGLSVARAETLDGAKVKPGTREYFYEIDVHGQLFLGQSILAPALLAPGLTSW